MRLKTPLTGLAVAGLFALAACGGGGSGPSAGESQDLTESGTSGFDAKAVGPATVEGATAGGTVNVIAGTGSLSTTLDPRGVYYFDTMQVTTNMVVRTLTQFKQNEDGSAVLVPDLATDLGQHNDDFTKWTFTLKDGLKYEDGSPITSEDIAYSVSSSLDCDTFTDCPSNYLLGGQLLGSDKLVTGKPDPDYLSGKKIVSGISTPDDKTIEFNFRDPFPDFSQYAYFPLFSPIKPELGADTANYARTVMATGPYKISKYNPGKTLDLVRNDQWDADSDPARAALPDAYHFDTTYSDPKQVDAVIKASKGDGANTLTFDEVDASDMETFPEDQLAKGPTPYTSWLAPLYDEVPVEVRKALTWAYPYQDAALAAGAAWNVNRIPTTTLMSPAVPGRQEVNGVPDHQAGQTDAQKAHDILEKADKLGFKISWLYITDDGVSPKVKDVVSAAYKKAGFDVAPLGVTGEEYSAKRADPATPVNVRAGGWGSDWPSGYSWIPPIFAPSDGLSVPCADQKWSSFGTVNYAKFCEDDVNQKINDVISSPIEDQPQGWTDLEKYIQDKYYPVIPIANYATIQAHGTAIMNHTIDKPSGYPTFKIMWVSQ